MTEQNTIQTVLSKATDTYMPLIERQLEENQITFSEYARECVVYGIMEMNNVLNANNLNWRDIQTSNIQEILMQIARLQLNAAVNPREVYFQIRNVSKKSKDESGKTVTTWSKAIEMGIEGDGNDALLSRFGRNVAKVYPYWVVREGDEFQYPQYVGVEMTPPKWIPKGTGKVMRVVYPVLDNDRFIHYYIGERADVKKNLSAHINNNLMNETFGIAKDRYSATPAQLKQINEKKAEIKAKVKAHNTLDDILDDPELSPYISPAWKEDFSRETMILRKIRNNIVKKIPMDFGNAFIQNDFDKVTDEGYRTIVNQIDEKTASKVIDAEFEPVVDVRKDESINTKEEPKTAQTANFEPNIEGRKKPDFDFD